MGVGPHDGTSGLRGSRGERDHTPTLHTHTKERPCGDTGRSREIGQQARNQLSGISKLDFPVSSSVRNKFLLLKPPSL